MKRRTGDDRERSLMGRAVWRRAVAEVHQLGLKQRIVYTVKSNRQLGQDAGTGAIGRGRGWACVGVRAIGGDALAMQVHACARADLPTLISGSAHPRQLRVWSNAAPSGMTLAGGLERALVAALVSRATSDSASI
jgi:hypothetical protein